jgi:hypothetical protein
MMMQGWRICIQDDACHVCGNQPLEHDGFCECKCHKYALDAQKYLARELEEWHDV